MDLVKLHKKAGEQTGKFIEGVKDEDWEKISVCTDWTVRDLVNHIVSENFWVPDILMGKTIEEVGDKYDGDVLGENPMAAYERSISLADEALTTPGVLEKIVHLSYGDLTARVYIGHRLIDLAVHGWDVAKSTGQPDELDEELVKAVVEVVKPQLSSLQNSGMFGEPVEVPEDAPLQTQLLGWLGRKR